MTTASILTLIALLLIVVAVAFYVIYWPQMRLNRIYHQQFPAQWLEILHRRLPIFQNLTEELQQQLQNQVKVFLNDKSFVGCGGQEINDEIRVTIAAQACLLLLNKKSSHYDQLQSILVYPSTFVTTRRVRDDLGLVSTNRAALLGESWSQGKVILAWDNVVLHEFAHQLDHESGTTNGAPVLQTRGAYKSWAQVFLKEFEELQHLAAQQQPSLMDHYGATNPAEFFAVATETFFECPLQMHRNHGELYRELVKFYRVDPTEWM